MQLGGTGGVFTGVFWLGLGLTGVMERVARLAGRPVVHGLVLPAMLILLAIGVVVAISREPQLLGDLAEATVRWRPPSPPTAPTWAGVLTGVVVLALPQAALGGVPVCHGAGGWRGMCGSAPGPGARWSCSACSCWSSACS